VSDSPSKVRTVLFALLGLGRGGTILYRVLFVLAVPALTVWTDIGFPPDSSRADRST
jgi:hypothetical protein